MPTSHSGLSSHGILNNRRLSHKNTYCTDMIPQLDGPTSVHIRRRLLENTRIEQETIQRTTVIPRGGYHDESDSNSHDNRRFHDG